MVRLLPPVHPDVRIWLVDLDVDDTAASHALLAPDEAARAARFVFDHHRRRFVAARAGLRRILATALDTTPAALSFTYNDSGKPELHHDLDHGGAPPLRFNVSHSDRYALVALTAAAAIGVDIEKTRPVKDVLNLARTAFSANELAVLTSLPVEARESAFFAGWTRKEAYIKARGDGLRLLGDFDVALAPGEPVRLKRVKGDADEPARWTLLSMAPVPGFAAALCLERRP
jgi:4'-phosphopantetheinyl transferase